MLLNVLVVEDEEYVRKSIVYKVDWAQLGFNFALEAENGLRALEIVEQQDIDVIITDIRMPGMNGLELIEKVKETHERMRFIIVSGHNEFEYAKKALSYNVSEYLLKPVKGSQLEKTLSKVKDELLKEKVDILYRKNIEKRFKENSELLQNYYLTKLIQSEEGSVQAQKNAQALGDEMPCEMVEVSVLRVLTTPAGGKDQDYSLLDSLDNMFQALQDIYTAENVHIYNNLKNAYEWIVINNFETDSEKSVRGMHSRAIKSITDEFGVNCIIGVGTCEQGLEKLPASYAKAELAVKEAIVIGVNRIIPYEDKYTNLNVNWLTVSDDQLIGKYLDTGNTASLKAYIEKVFRTLRTHNEQINHLAYYSLALDLFVILKKHLQRNSEMAGSDNDFEPEFLSELTGLATLEEIIKWCEMCIMWYESLITESDNSTGKDLVGIIRSYITNNYGADITLGFVAEKYNISPNYLSRVFKIYSNESFKSFITRIRMEKAIELMMGSELKLYSISEMVGYEDPKYFSKVFKNYFGFPPSRFDENKDTM